MEEKIKLAAGVYKLNGQLGAINPENMTFGAKLLDLGHLNIGYPLTSGAYRCTLCKGIEGGSGDRQIMGFFDYYFERPPSYEKLIKMDQENYKELMNSFSDYLESTEFTRLSHLSWGEFTKLNKIKVSFTDLRKTERFLELRGHFYYWKFNKKIHTRKFKDDKEAYKFYLQNSFRSVKNSYSFDIKKNEASLFIKELSSELGKNIDIKLSKKEFEAFKMIGSEELYISRNWNDIRAFGENILGVQLARNVRPERISYSFKSLMQFAGLKSFLSPSEYLQLRKMLRQIVVPESAKYVDIAVELFERVLKQKHIRSTDLKKLYVEYYPTNYIQDDVTLQLSKVNNSDDAVKVTQELFKKYTSEINIEPRRYYEEIINLYNAK